MISITLTLYFIFIHLFFFLSIPTILALEFNLSIQNHIMCIETERQALLSFKQGLDDSYDILSSWDTRVNDDCCNWRGVQCNNNTGHIITLDLHGSFPLGLPRSFPKYLEGKVGSSLAQLSHLNYLDLSHNFLYGTLLENNIGSLINLNYLNLSHNNFEGVIPPHLGNLSKLSILDLGRNNYLFIKDHADNLGWLSSLSSLKHLDLSFVNLSSVNDWASVINKLTLLQSLSLRYCELQQPILPSHSYTNFSRVLVELDLFGNSHLNSSILPWLINFSNSLIHLDLRYNNLQGLNIDDFANMTFLAYLGLSVTEVDLRSTKAFENLCNLKSLYLSGNNVGGLLSDFLKIFSGCVLNSLQYLHLSSNKFFGYLPNFTMFSSLKGIDLSYNMLNGTIPQSLGQLSNLEYLDLRNNSFKGEVFEPHHLSKLTNLRHFDLSKNSLIFDMKSNWVPPFQLEFIALGSCKLGPLFPKWLQTQNFSYLDISNAGISDIIPRWFWNNLSPKLNFLDLSRNKIKGEIPNLSMKFKELIGIYLQSNEFVGQIPPFLLLAEQLDLSNNKFSDLTCLCEITNSPSLTLDLSNNQLSGQLPNCWDHMLGLEFLSLADNTFSGDIPHFIGNLTSLRFLSLRNNQFSGDLSCLSNLTDLNVFDVMKNNLSGIIPSWIGSKLPNMILLNLKSNHFHGNIPSSLCNLKNIQVLDISANNISGTIPTCIHNFNVLTETSMPKGYISSKDLVMVWKGQERLIEGEVVLLERSIDLSCNHLTGKIPGEITELVGLISLNLSRNELTGQIPNNMGQLHSLESLDLSINHLSGPIPSSLSQISTLGVLNLSYNNLWGKIPTGPQLQGFPTSSYEGNPHLYGDPLKKCREEVTQEPSINNAHVENENRNEDKLMIGEFFISMSFGFTIGFWGIFGSLVIHRRWRHAYFKFFRDIIDKVI